MSAAPRNCEVVSKRARMLRCSGGDRTSRGQRLASSVHRQLHAAFTLIEVLIVVSLMLLLAGIALPTTKELLSDQKASRAARSVAAYIDQARNEAIAKGQFAGVRIERLVTTENVEYGSAAAIRLQRIAGVPAYAGEAADSMVQIMGIAPNGIASIRFAASDNLLLTLYDQPNPPISDGDLIELPGGKLFPIDFISTVEFPLGSGVNYVNAEIDLNSPEHPSIVGSTETFPLGHLVPRSGFFAYRIHRKPTISATDPLSFSRGIVIDLNYSGIGIGGSDFAPTDLTPNPPGDTNRPIDILFGPDGRVHYVSIDSLGNVGPAFGMIYLCLGTTDGVVEPIPPATTLAIADLFQNDGQLQSNITNPDSIWIVINPNTGRVVTAPFASVTGIPTTVGEGLTTARGLAILSDTLDAAP